MDKVEEAKKQYRIAPTGMRTYRRKLLFGAVKEELEAELIRSQTTQKETFKKNSCLPWSQEDIDKLLAYREKKMTFPQIGRMLKRSEKSCSYAYKKVMGITGSLTPDYQAVGKIIEKKADLSGQMFIFTKLISNAEADKLYNGQTYEDDPRAVAPRLDAPWFHKVEKGKRTRYVLEPVRRAGQVYDWGYFMVKLPVPDHAPVCTGSSLASVSCNEEDRTLWQKNHKLGRVPKNYVQKGKKK